MKKRRLSERNQALVDKINSTGPDEPKVFTKQRVITYASAIFLPPYALYRIWMAQSELRRSEKYVWTMIVAAYMIYFVRLMVMA